MSTTIVNLVLGSILLVAGRKLFWLFVGAVGFLLGYTLANDFFAGESESTILVMGLVVGIIGAVLALFFKKVLVGIAGFIAGGYLAISMLDIIGWDPGLPAWMLFTLGGIIGVVLVSVLFGWGLIILSSLVGAFLITEALPLGDVYTTFIIIVLLLVGVMIQMKFTGG
jgi:hypothetical protein